ncbi:unnamed protein product [Moneuplotes crassus]|uniref:Uncharacterized protein n=1 Tax=Euplotes crassus TaxID=5936 RepID=A0AAD1UHR6_EUPCR|nr:unnamed protein product [Moneuplotes crassus]
MDLFKNSEENITDEILDEHVSRPSLIQSLHLDTKCSKAPFDHKLKTMKFRKVTSFPVPDPKTKLPSSDFESSTESRRLSHHKKSAMTESSTKTLQSDIRDLLQKAIQIRKLHTSLSDSQETPTFTHPDRKNRQNRQNPKNHPTYQNLQTHQPPSERLVTVTDLASPFC